MLMTNYTPELIAKARSAKSAEELFELAKANEMEITEEDAKLYFAQLNANGAVADDELDAVAGGGSCPGGDDEEDEGSSSSGTYKVHCSYCQGLVSRGVTKCPWCGKTLTLF
jgi:hypothetical protein